MWGIAFAKFVALWRSLPAGVKGFTLGIAVGLLLSLAFSLRGQDSARQERVARQNAEAALDSTRAIAAHHDTVFARLLAQKDVEFRGAVATAARLRRDKANLSARLAVSAPAVRTTATHRVDGPGGVRDGAVRGATTGTGSGGATAPGDVSGTGASVTDSLVLSGPPVEGTVGVTVTPRPGATQFDWDARLRPSPVDLEVGLGCGEDGPELLTHGPPFARVEIKSGEVDPDVCNPPKVRVGLVRRGLEVVGGVAVVVGVVKVITGIIH